MKPEYTSGIAFILEGATEKVFYRSYLKWLSKERHCTFEKGDVERGDIVFEWKNESETILIKFNVVGAITQDSHSANWFANRCVKEHRIPWRVFLCYDTDSHDYDISKFYSDDWEVLRKDLKKAKAKEIIDLAAEADIEDIMLCDIEGICKYLSIKVPEKVSGRKGKAKMKSLFRMCGKAYHEGDRAEPMIESLEFKKIAETCPLALWKVEEALGW